MNEWNWSKKALVLATVLAILSGCATVPKSFGAVPAFDTPQQINDWIYDNIRYSGVNKTIDDYQSPEYTLQTRQGVCIDMCALFVYLAEANGYGFMRPRMVPVEIGKGRYHVIVDCGPSGYYDPTNDNWLGYELPKGWKVTTWD